MSERERRLKENFNSALAGLEKAFEALNCAGCNQIIFDVKELHSRVVILRDTMTKERAEMNCKNMYGLDIDYFEKKLKGVLRDLNNYRPEEIARELARLSKAADKEVLSEPEFASGSVIKSSGPITINM